MSQPEATMFKTATCILALAALSLPAIAAEVTVDQLKNGQPKPVKVIIDRITICDHFAGEEGYDAARRKEINAAMTRYKCDKVENDTAKLLKQYKDQPLTIKAINGAVHLYD